MSYKGGNFESIVGASEGVMARINGSLTEDTDAEALMD